MAARGRPIRGHPGERRGGSTDDADVRHEPRRACSAYPDLDVTIQEADVAPLQVQGPKSKDLMVKLLGEDILGLRYYFWTEAKIGGVPVVVTRTGWTSEIGYEVYTTDTSRGNDVFE